MGQLIFFDPALTWLPPLLRQSLPGVRILRHFPTLNEKPGEKFLVVALHSLAELDFCRARLALGISYQLDSVGERALLKTLKSLHDPAFDTPVISPVELEGPRPLADKAYPRLKYLEADFIITGEVEE